jgi:hypothetical protein
MVLTNVAAQTKKEHRAFSFPSNINRMHSSTSNLFAAYLEIPSAQNSTKQYLLSIMDDDGNHLAQHSFTRSVEGMWSPFGGQLFLNDFIGSSQIDCLVWNRTDARLTSLTEILLHDPNSGPIEGRGAKPPENPDNSRFELTCQEWKDMDKVLVRLEGNTWAGGDFTYKLVYDLRAKKFSWE